jgi:DNA repair protein RAD5
LRSYDSQVTVEHLEFSPLERKIYSSLYSDAKKDFERLNAKGLVNKNYTHVCYTAFICTESAEMFEIRSWRCSCGWSRSTFILVSALTVFHSLRRAVLHPNLVLLPAQDSDRPSTSGQVDVEALIKRFSDGGSGENGTNVFAAEVLSNLGEEEDRECPICFDVMQTPMIIPECLHQW